MCRESWWRYILQLQLQRTIVVSYIVCGYVQRTMVGYMVQLIQSVNIRKQWQGRYIVRGYAQRSMVWRYTVRGYVQITVVVGGVYEKASTVMGYRIYQFVSRHSMCRDTQNVHTPSSTHYYYQWKVLVETEISAVLI